ncbi:glycoside hydrolase family 16 protein [Nocardioides marmoriginsengisoli]|uniref:Glycoside hydrolase family 16 protein n=1 Tax=Nocardioides marmoriginsengisoli TaxID=661483 RepID=A0A3N0CCP5_9ACTN|nr:glycoside hydrolase family 16 protein [Nocardioides marmoriginsengisoli]RNL61227.1 glycoside hydrolase family 16 protein [Nocardioides marmoriginsengisoli]
MKYVIALVVGLAGTLVLSAPAEAQQVRGLTVAMHHVGKSVVVSGKVKGHARKVRIEQRKSGRWVVVRKVAVRKGAFRVSLRAPARTQLRAAAAGRVSRTVVVKATAAKVAPAAKVAFDGCGPLLRKADGSTWSCTFSDEFNGSDLDRSVWTPQTAFAMGTQASHACYADDPSTVNVSGGSLNLSVRKVRTPVSCTFAALSGPTSYVSGGVMSYRTFGQQYGRYEARIKNTATKYPGLHEAFWLWPDDRVASKTVWPYAGEIDISETYSSYPTLSIPFLHYSADAYGPLPGINTAWNCYAPRGQWNTYAMEWTAKKVQIFVNGKSCLTNTSGDAAFAKPYIMMLTQGLGAAGNVYDGRAPLGTMNVDYVRVWK